jgi:ABC-type dipeptide/oligopeptide/nickel transport system permease subunit
MSAGNLEPKLASPSNMPVAPVAEDKLPGPLAEFWYSFRQNRGAVIGLGVVVVFVLIALLAPWLAPYDPTIVHENSFKLSPVWAEGGSSTFLLGTDDVGRDFLSRLIYGARISMGVGFMVVIFSLSLGVAIGLLAGYVGGWVDTVIMRLTDILLSLPSILLSIVVVTILGQNLANAIIAVGILVVPSFVRLVRASVLVERDRQYVIASRSFGSGHFRQAVLNILPNCLAPVIVQATLGFSDGILNVAALGFLGLGAQPPTAEWGTMLSDGRAYIESASWLVTLPGLCILAVVLGFNLLGDGLRDALDPRLKR